MAKYFLSYRRGTDITAISARLGQEFGQANILVDSNFQRGPRVDDLIQDALHGCVAMLPVIDAHWISQVVRLADPLDWVRLEIATALKQGIPLVPLLLDAGRVPPPEEMPADVRELAHRNGHPLDLAVGFDDQMAELIQHLKLLERGHRWTRARLSQVQSLAYGGNWHGALTTCRDALKTAQDSFERRQNRVYPLLCNFYDLLVILTNALHAFERGHFAHVKLVLDGGQEHEIAHAAYELADIGVAVARSLYQRDRPAFIAETLRLERVLNDVQEKWVVPGAVQVGDFVKNGDIILSNMAALTADMEALTARVAALHEAAVQRYESHSSKVSHAFRRSVPATQALRTASDLSSSADAHVGPKARDDGLNARRLYQPANEQQPSPSEYKGPSSVEWKTWLWLIGTRFVAGPEPWSPFLAHSWRLVLASLVVGINPLSNLNARSWRSLSEWLLAEPPRRRVSEEFEEPPPRERPLAPNMDRIQFTVTAPAVVRPGAVFPVFVWAHDVGEQGKVIEYVRAHGADALLRETHDPDGTSIISLRMQADGLVLEQYDQPMFWNGPAFRGTFFMQCSRTTPPGMGQVAVDVYVDLLKIARLDFSLEVGEATAPVDYLPCTERRARRVFASYVEKDRGYVMVRLQRLGQWAPGLVVNLACEKLRKQSDWDKKMTWYINGHDLFYLFWSPDALKSDAVEREWRCAMSQGGSNFLSAVVVGGDAAPPAALKNVPFYRWDQEQAVS